MKIWLIKDGDPLPIKENIRLMRMASLAKYLSENGHEVLWWTSSFMHYEKRYVCHETKKMEVRKKETLYLLHSPLSYRKNISIKRFIYHYLIGKELKKHIYREERPDIIVCCWPTADLAEVALEYGEKNKVPVILDARDQWPDIFVRVFPKTAQRIGTLLLSPLKNKARKLFGRANGITAVTDSMLEWACGYADRKPGDSDKTIYIGNRSVELSDEQFSGALDWWSSKGINRSDWIICFFSTFGKHIAIDVPIRAIKELSQDYPNIKLVIGGGGDREKELKEIADNCDNVIFAGWLDNIKMASLMRIAKCGVFSIKNTFDFRDTFNNKAIQYISEGLPILNSLSGFAKRLIEEKNMGLTYECDSVDDCKEKILWLFTHEDDRKTMGNNGHECFCEMFEADMVNKQFEDYLIKIYSKYYSDK